MQKTEFFSQKIEICFEQAIMILLKTIILLPFFSLTVAFEFRWSFQVKSSQIKFYCAIRLALVYHPSSNSARLIAAILELFSIPTDVTRLQLYTDRLICHIPVFSYHQKDHMRIALNIDVALLLSQLVFFIGLSTSDNMVRKLSSISCYSYEKCELSVNNRERSLV